MSHLELKREKIDTFSSAHCNDERCHCLGVSHFHFHSFHTKTIIKHAIFRSLLYITLEQRETTVQKENWETNS